jgi:hypothetical protein
LSANGAQPLAVIRRAPRLSVGSHTVHDKVGIYLRCVGVRHPHRLQCAELFDYHGKEIGPLLSGEGFIWGEGETKMGARLFHTPGPLRNRFHLCRHAGNILGIEGAKHDLRSFARLEVVGKDVTESLTVCRT